MRAINHELDAVTPREAPLTLSYYLRLVAVRWWIPVSLALLCACLSLVYTGLQSTTYQSRATTLLSPLDPATADEFTRLTPTIARLLRSDSVLLDARQAYLNRSPGADPLRTGPDELRVRTSVIVPRDTTLFEVTAQGSSQRDASALVGSVVEAASRRVSSLGARPTTRTGVAVPPRLDIFGPPVPEGKVSPTPTRNLVVGINVGLLLGIAGALLLRDPRRARMRADDLARLLDASDLAYTPLPSQRLLRDRPASGGVPSGAVGEGVRLLATTVQQGLQQNRCVVLLLGDLSPQRLRWVALGLAANLAHTGLRPALVEADYYGTGFRTSRDGGRSRTTGNASRTADGIEVDTATQNGDGPGRFTVYPRGEQPHEPAFAFAGDAYQSFLGELASAHDVVLIVGPATERQAEVRALADSADSVLLLLPAWIPHSRAAELTTLRSIRSDANLVVGIFGDAEDVPLAAGNR
jgi:polysaccharide biosynthesis transport protein